MSYQVQVYFGDQPLGAADGVKATVGSSDPRKALDALGHQLAEVLQALRPDRLAFSEAIGAEAIELEVGFSIEVAGGSRLRLIISPKANMGCKAKVSWKRLAEDAKKAD